MEDEGVEKIGLLAGVGKLPVEFAAAAGRLGFAVHAVALLDEVDEALQGCVQEYAKISVGQLDAVIGFLQERGIGKVTMIGKVTKELLLGGQLALDERGRKLLFSLPDHSDDTIMLAIVREFAQAGIKVVDQTMLIRSLMVEEGVHTRRAPSEAEKADMEFGFKMAKAIGGLDIGQTVVIKDLAVLAVEAVEGTDACILRGGALAADAVVAKVAKPKQDVRFDMPTVGTKTIESMIAAGAKALVMEAGKTLLVERKKVIALADQNGITIEAL